MEFEEEEEFKKQSYEVEDYSPFSKAENYLPIDQGRNSSMNADYMQFCEGPRSKSVRGSLVNSPNRPLKLIEYISQHATSSGAESLNLSYKQGHSRPKSQNVASFTVPGNDDHYFPTQGDEDPDEVDLRQIQTENPYGGSLKKRQGNVDCCSIM